MTLSSLGKQSPSHHPNMLYSTLSLILLPSCFLRHVSRAQAHSSVD